MNPQLLADTQQMLVGLLSPDWGTKLLGDFLPAMREREHGITEYERQSSETLSSNIKVAVLPRQSPQDVKNALRMSLGAGGSDCAHLKQTLVNCCMAGRDSSRECF